MAPDGGDIPQWAANLQASVAKIEARTDAIPDIVQELKELRANTVPMQEHVKLMNDVDILKDRDLGARSDWEDIKSRVLADKGMLPTLWEERVQLRGAITTLRVLFVILGLVVTVLTIATLFHGLGGNVSFGH